ncbi:uncharacterized protein LOC132717365 [Ruditapes philippinarum]|uniref:uncharacterized protein LOC132717365 n=1 Tax=Ruditapes philippinarum TaxID=129788 RepID=UPI00295B06C2|nr:uncharacterized protein LOC132717365 [Ruditapes philippinarum]
MADSMIYFLVQWEDCYMSVISPDSVLLPKKNSKWDYEEGDLIEAVYNRGKSYQAVISEIHPNRKYLLQQAKLPPKHCYEIAKRMISMGFGMSVSESEKTSNNTLVSGKKGGKSDGIAVAVDLIDKPADVPNQPEPDNTAVSGMIGGQADGVTAKVDLTGKTADMDVTNPPESGLSKFSAEVIVANKRTSGSESPDVIKEEIRALRRKIRKLEDRVVAIESGGSSQQDNLLKLVSHLDANDVQQVLSTLCKAIFSNVELMNCSRTGKRTNKCSERGPRPPLDIVKLEKLEHLVREKTNISKDCFIKKFENMQKTLRQKKKQ